MDLDGIYQTYGSISYFPSSQASGPREVTCRWMSGFMRCRSLCAGRGQVGGDRFGPCMCICVVFVIFHNFLVACVVLCDSTACLCLCVLARRFVERE